MAGFTVGNTNIFTSNTFSGTFNGFTSTNQLVFEAAPVFQGSVSGYASGGLTPSNVNIIDKFSFAVDGNATDVGDLTQSIGYVAGQSSSVSGYASGGGPPETDVIDKFPFSVDTNASDIGNLSESKRQLSGQSSTSSGYASGGFLSTPPTVNSTVIDKFSFSVDSSATNIGDLTQARRLVAGQSSTVSGYSSGGVTDAGSPPSLVNTIDKFPFASDSGGSDVGDLSQGRYSTAGQSSTVFGYNSGGYSPAGRLNTIDKFPFANDNNATDIGNLSQSRSDPAGQSSTVSGYSSGGVASGPTVVNTIDKFPFASDTDASDVGDLFQARFGSAGQQV